jgi:branched-chain amino acid transport system substrate-binding protein
MSERRTHHDPGGPLRSRRQRCLAILVACPALCLAGCGSIVTTSGTGPTTTVVAGPSFTLGYLGPLTGPDAGSGLAMEQGAQLAVQQFDADHPSYDVQLVTGDTGDGRTAAVAAARLVRAGVVGVIGPGDDTAAEQADPVLAAAGIPQIVVSATADDLTDGADPGFHRVVAEDTAAGADDAAFLLQRDATSVTVVAEGPGDLTLRTSFTEALDAQADAITVGTPVSITPGAAAAEDAASQIVSQVPPPGWVFFGGDAATGGQLVEDLHADGYSGDILLAGPAGDPAQALASGWPGDGDHAYLSCPCEGTPASSSTPALDFVTAYRAANGAGPPEWSAQAFDAANTLLRAATPAAAHPDATTTSTVGGLPRTVSAADVERALDLPGFSYDGVSGPIAFSPDGDLVNAPVWISDVAGGRVTQEETPVTAPAGTAGS